MISTPLDLTSEMQVSDSELQKMAAVITAANPPAPPHVPKELRIINVLTGGFGLIVDKELVGVAYEKKRLLALVESWVDNGLDLTRLVG